MAQNQPPEPAEPPPSEQQLQQVAEDSLTRLIELFKKLPDQSPFDEVSLEELKHEDPLDDDGSPSTPPVPSRRWYICWGGEVVKKAEKGEGSLAETRIIRVGLGHMAPPPAQITTLRYDQILTHIPNVGIKPDLSVLQEVLAHILLHEFYHLSEYGSDVSGPSVSGGTSADHSALIGMTQTMACTEAAVWAMKAADETLTAEERMCAAEKKKALCSLAEYCRRVCNTEEAAQALRDKMPPGATHVENMPELPHPAAPPVGDTEVLKPCPQCTC